MNGAANGNGLFYGAIMIAAALAFAAGVGYKKRGDSMKEEQARSGETSKEKNQKGESKERPHVGLESSDWDEILQEISKTSPSITSKYKK